MVFKFKRTPGDKENHAARLAELVTRMIFLCGVEFTLWRYLLRSMLDISEVQRWAQGVNCLDVRLRWQKEVAGDVQGQLNWVWALTKF